METISKILATELTWWSWRFLTLEADEFDFVLERLREENAQGILRNFRLELTYVTNEPDRIRITLPNWCANLPKDQLAATFVLWRRPVERPPPVN